MRFLLRWVLHDISTSFKPVWNTSIPRLHRKSHSIMKVKLKPGFHVMSQNFSHKFGTQG